MRNPTGDQFSIPSPSSANMVPVALLLILGTTYKVNAEPEPAAWPLFEFWNPLTWLKPQFSSETVLHIFRSGRGSSRKIYQQLKKALLPANLFFGNIRAQYAAWDKTKEKKLREIISSQRQKA